MLQNVLFFMLIIISDVTNAIRIIPSTLRSESVGHLADTQKNINIQHQNGMKYKTVGSYYGQQIVHAPSEALHVVEPPHYLNANGFMPMIAASSSQQDIQVMKSQPVSELNTKVDNKIRPEMQSFQIDPKQRLYQQQQEYQNRPVELDNIKNTDFPYGPPIVPNYMPVEPLTFETIHDQVKKLKERQREFFLHDTDGIKDTPAHDMSMESDESADNAKIESPPENDSTESNSESNEHHGFYLHQHHPHPDHQPSPDHRGVFH